VTPSALASVDALVPGFRCESTLECAVIADPALVAGLRWGAPRRGHPEGPVGHHVAAILGCIGAEDPLRQELRFLALVHDAFKRSVRPDVDWSAENDHAMRARRFAERFVGEERLLAALELHDAPYWLWRTRAGPDELDATLERIPDLELFVRFVELDATTEGKDLTFLWWLRRELAARGRLPARVAEVPLPATDAADTDDALYVKTFATHVADQADVASALRDVIAEHAARLDADGRVLVSEDGLRVVLSWRWRGSATARLLRDGEIVRQALTAHPVLISASALDARLYRAF
jgi:hypothetical protein